MVPTKVNLREFEIRLTITCLNRAQSILSWLGKFFSVLSISSRPFSFVYIEKTSNISVITSFKSTIYSTGLNFPILILKRSIKSFT
jgi:hypothetical protein